MPNTASPFTASAANLNRLVIIRLIFLLGIFAALTYTHITIQTFTIHLAHITTVILLIMLNAFTYWRLKQNWPVTDVEYFCQLLSDVIALTVLLYVSGGATNPFVEFRGQFT